MGYKIEKNVPMPTGMKLTKYPWKEMEVGDSFVVADDKVVRIRSATQAHNNTHEEKFVVRKGHDGIYRCWRKS